MRGIPIEDVLNSMNALFFVIEEQLSPEAATVLRPYLDGGLQALAAESEPPSTFLDTRDPLIEMTRSYLELLLKGKRNAASQLILEAVRGGMSISDVYLRVFRPAQYEVGRLWHTNQISVGQEHLFTAATQHIMSQLYDRIFSTRRNGRALVATCVGGDLHEIGCRMLADLFEMDGWDTYYLGANTPSASVLKAVEDHQAELLCISATMSFHLRSVAELVAAARKAHPTRKLTILVGGYPFKVETSLWREVGADASAGSAEEAVQLMRRPPA